MTAQNFALGLGAILHTLFVFRVMGAPSPANLAQYLLFPDPHFLLLRLLRPAFFERHRTLLVAALYSWYSLFMNQFLQTILTNTPEHAALFNSVIVYVGTPSFYLGTFIAIDDVRHHGAALVLSYALWSHKQTFTKTWNGQALTFALGVLAPLGLNAASRWRAGRPGAGAAAGEGSPGSSRAKSEAEAQFRPTFRFPRPADGAPPAAWAISYKFNGPNTSDLDAAAVAALRHALEKEVSTKLGRSVQIAIAVRQGCVMLRVSCLTKTDEGKWALTAEGPPADEVLALLPEGFRHLVTSASASSDAPSIQIQSMPPALALPNTLLPRRWPGLTGLLTANPAPPIALSVTLSLRLEDTAPRGAAAAAAPRSPADLAARFEPVCWIGRHMNKLAVHGPPVWTVPSAAAAARVTFSALMDPAADGVMEEGLEATHLLVGLEPRGSGGAPVVTTIPLLPSKVFSELSSLPEEAQEDLVSDIAVLLDLRADTKPGDAMSDAVSAAAHNVGRFARCQKLSAVEGLAAALVRPRAAQRRGNPSSTGQIEGSWFIAADSLLATLGARFPDRQAEGRYGHQSVRKARRRHAAVTCVRLLFMSLGPAFGVVPFKQMRWGLLGGWAVVDLAMTAVALGLEARLHRAASVTWMKVFAALQAASFCAINAQWPMQFYCSLASDSLYWLKFSAPEALLLSASCSGPWATALASALASYCTIYYYLRTPQCLSLEPPGGLTPGQITAASTAAYCLCGLAFGFLWDRRSRREFLASVQGEAARRRDEKAADVAQSLTRKQIGLRAAASAAAGWEESDSAPRKDHDKDI